MGIHTKGEVNLASKLRPDYEALAQGEVRKSGLTLHEIYPTSDGVYVHIEAGNEEQNDRVKGLLLTLSKVLVMTKKTRKASSPKTTKVPRTPKAKTVFVVHGRNEPARQAMFALIRAFGLRPLEWEQAVALTGSASPYLGEVIEKGMAAAQAVVVLLTGDDEARLRSMFRDPGENEEDLSPQPRPNVLYEAGMAMGKSPQRTVLVELGPLRGLSDIGGKNTVRLDNSVAKRTKVRQRLLNAGCAIADDGGMDWHSAGDFVAAIAASSSTSSKAVRKGTRKTKRGTSARRATTTDKHGDDRARKHDEEVFHRAEQILNESRLGDILSVLSNDHSIRDAQSSKLLDLEDFFGKTGNAFLDETLQKEATQLRDALDRLSGFVATHFFVLGRDASKVVMYPELNPDRGGRGAPEESRRYRQYEKELAAAIKGVRTAYSSYRTAVKSKLFV